MKSDVSRLNAAADPFDFALQRSLETMYKTTFVATNSKPQRNNNRFKCGGGSAAKGNANGGRAGNAAAQ